MCDEISDGKLITRHDVTGCVICISNNVEYLKKEKFSQRSYIVILTYLCNTLNKILDKISFHMLSTLNDSNS